MYKKILILFFIITFFVFVYGEKDEVLSIDNSVDVGNTTGTKDEFLRLAKEAEKSGNTLKAIENYKKYLNLDGYNDGNAVFALGDLYFKSSLYEYAMTTFEKDKSNNWKNYFGVATCARFLGYYNKAINNYLKVISMKPNFAEGYLGLAISYQLSLDFDNALLYFKKYLEFYKKEEVYITMVNILLKLEKKEDAKAVIEEGLNYFPNSNELRKLSERTYK